MARIQRGLIPLIEDLDRRARPSRSPRNRPILKYTSIEDTVYFSSDPVTLVVSTGNFYWHPAASTAQSLVWGLSQWSS